MPDDPAEMEAQARRCRRLARSASGQTRNTLNLLAEDYEKRRKAADEETGIGVPVMRLRPPGEAPQD